MSKCVKCKKESASLREFSTSEASDLCSKCEKEWLRVFMYRFPNYRRNYPSSREWMIAWRDWLGIELEPVKVVFT